MSALLIVDRLPCHFYDDELAALFQPFGHVLSARVVRDGRRHSLEFGFVQMENAEQAAQAMFTLNGYQLNGHPITVALVRNPASTST
jgi:RNA recognition motif-containing protein